MAGRRLRTAAIVYPGQTLNDKLAAAIVANRADDVCQLLDVGANPNHGIWIEGASVLAFAAFHNYSAVVEHLLNAGASCTRCTRQGETPLLYASAAISPPVAAQLIRAGADCNAADPHGVTPLIRAATASNVSVLSTLLEHGADCNRRTKTGWTALMSAAQAGDKDAVACLLAAGADCTPRGLCDQTAHDIACKRGHLAAARLLRRAPWLRGALVLVLAGRRCRPGRARLPPELWDLIAADFAPV